MNYKYSVSSVFKILLSPSFSLILEAGAVFMSLLLFYWDLVSTLKGTSQKYQNFTDSIIVCTFGSFVNTHPDVSTLILEDVWGGML